MALELERKNIVDLDNGMPTSEFIYKNTCHGLIGGGVLNKKNFVVGVLGVATNATVNFFEQWAKVFPAEKEWDRPRIIIDNRCTMPSRVRALLYNENTDVLVNQMTDSIKLLTSSGCSKILIACNTAHVFLEPVYKKFPAAKKYVVDIIDGCAEFCRQQGAKKIFLMASEGTILSEIYKKSLNRRGIEYFAPSEEEFPILRSFIESVKQDKITEEVKNSFIEFVRHSGAEGIILGCTELPVLYDKCNERLGGIKFFDPMMIALKKLQMEFNEL